MDSIDNEIRLKEIAQAGAMLKNLIGSAEYAIFDREVLKEIEHGAFEIFCKVDPKDDSAVAQAQKMYQVVSQIRARIEQKIQQGKLANMQLNPSTQEDDE